MLDQTDIDRVSAYIYEGFPKLKGYVAVRRFDPPSLNLKKLLPEERSAIYQKYIPILREDILSQISVEERESVALMLDATIAESGGNIRIELDLAPICLELGSVEETPDGPVRVPSGHYFITQFPSGLDHKTLWPDVSPVKVPAEFNRASGLFNLAHEFTHAALLSQGRPYGFRQEEAICDGVASACVLSLEGRGAKHALSIIRDGRLRAESGSSHDTGVFLLHLLGDKAFPAQMNAKEALGHAERLYDSMYPVENTVKAQPVLAL